MAEEKKTGTSPWASFGFGTASQLVGNLMNMPFQEWNRQQNYIYNEKAAENADERWRKQYLDFFAPKAQVQQYRDAGLSPSLMYGTPQGAGGATAPQGGGAGGLQGGFAPLDPTTLAQIELTKSQVNLNNAEADNLKEDTTSKEIENYIADLTKDISVQERKENLQVLIALGTKYLSESNLNIAKKNKTQWEQTWEQIKSNEELNLLRNQNALYLAQIVTEGTKQELNEQQTTTLTAQIDKWQMDVTQRFYELDIASWNQEAQQNWWEAQAQNLTNTLEFEAKKLNLELDFGKKKMWVDNIFDVGKTAMIATGMVFTRGSVNLNTPKVTFGKPKPVGFQ